MIERDTDFQIGTKPPCTIHGVVCCAECDAMTDEQRWQMEQHLQNEQWESNMTNLYTYGEDGFCDGFTNW
jgi:hypothetical protein